MGVVNCRTGLFFVLIFAFPKGTFTPHHRCGGYTKWWVTGGGILTAGASPPPRPTHPGFWRAHFFYHPKEKFIQI